MPHSRLEPDDSVNLTGKVIEDHGDQVVIRIPSLRGSMTMFVPREHVEKKETQS